MIDLTHCLQTIAARDVLAQAAPTEISTGKLPINTVGEDLDDRVIRSLSSALEAAERGRDRYCIGALRLAIAVRLAGLRSETRKADEAGGAMSSGRQIRPLQKWRLKRVKEHVENHLSEKISLSDLAAVAGLSRMHFASQFRTATGLRPHEFLLRRRVQRAERLLRESAIPIVEIALTVGFQTQAHFTTVFKRFVGSSPHQWRSVNEVQRVAAPRASTRADLAAEV